MKKIIVATDYSASAEVALLYAVMLAKAANAEIVLINVYKFDVTSLNELFSADAMNGLVEDNLLRLQLYAKRIAVEHDVPVTCFTSTADIEDTLSQYVNKLKADLVVMGLRRAHGVLKSPANTTTSVISSANFPVLVIPETAAIGVPVKFLFACDYRHLPGVDILEKLNELIAAVDAELKILHVKTSAVFAGSEELEEGVKADLESCIAKTKHSYKEIEAGVFTDGLEQGLSSFQPDVLIMAPHKYAFWNSLFHKSMTKEVVSRSSLPLLSLPS